MMKLPPRSPPPNREDSYIIEVGQNETHEDVVRRHPDVLFIQGDVLFKQAGTGPLTVRRRGADCEQWRKQTRLLSDGGLNLQ